MKNVVKKLNWVLPNVTSKIWTKSIRPMVCAKALQKWKISVKALSKRKWNLTIIRN